MNERTNGSDERLLNRLSGLAAGGRPEMDPGLEARLLAQLGRRRRRLRFPWDVVLLGLLLAGLAWEVARLIRFIFG